MIAYFTYHSLSATHPGIQDALRLAFDARGSLPARQTSRTRRTDQSAPMRCYRGYPWHPRTSMRVPGWGLGIYTRNPIQAGTADLTQS